jgi:hypothetical protein
MNLDTMDLDDLARCDGIGRNILEGRIRALVVALKLERRDAKQLDDNLTSTQARCTALLEELRAYRGSGICLPGWWCNECRGFNGEARGRRDDCRACGAQRPT